MWPAAFISISNNPLTTLDLVAGDNPINSHWSFQSGFNRLLLYFSLGQPQHSHSDQTAPSCPVSEGTCASWLACSVTWVTVTWARPDGDWHIYRFHLTSGRPSLRSREERIHIPNDLGRNNQPNCCMPCSHSTSLWVWFSTRHRGLLSLRWSVCQGFSQARQIQDEKGRVRGYLNHLVFVWGILKASTVLKSKRMGKSHENTLPFLWVWLGTCQAQCWSPTYTAM